MRSMFVGDQVAVDGGNLDGSCVRQLLYLWLYINMTSC